MICFTSDVIVLTGDLVDASVNSLRKAAEPLQDLHSKYGNFFVSGIISIAQLTAAC